MKGRQRAIQANGPDGDGLVASREERCTIKRDTRRYADDERKERKTTRIPTPNVTDELYALMGWWKERRRGVLG